MRACPPPLSHFGAPYCNIRGRIGAVWQVRIFWLDKEVAEQHPTTLTELQAAIQVAANATPMDSLKKAIDGVHRRIALCLGNDGGVFKNQIARPPNPQAAHLLDISILKEGAFYW